MGSSGSAPDVGREDVRTLVERTGRSGEPLTATEAADRLGCSPRTARTHLQELAERGHVRSKRIDDAARIWWAAADPNAADDSDEAQLSAFVDAVEDYAIFMLDPEGTVISWNNGASRIKGYDEADVLGSHFSRFHTDEDVEAGVPDRNLETARRTGRVEDEGWRVRADGSTFWANITLTAVRDDAGSLRGFTKVTRDMTERREYERRLRQERDLTDRLLETVPVGLCLCTDAGSVVRANERFLDRFGGYWATSDDATVSAWDLYDADENPIPTDQHPVSRVVATGDPVIGKQVLADRADGSRRWLSIDAAPVDSAGGDVDRVVLAVEDITDRKRREHDLARRKAELETELGEVLGRITDGFYALDRDWRFTHVNERAEELLDVRDRDLVGEHVWDVFEWIEESRLFEEYERAMETQESTSFEFYYPEPVDAWFEINAYPSETGLSVYFRDVTGRKQRQRELERTERRFEAIFEDPNILVGLLDPDGMVLDINETAMAYVDADLASIRDRPFWETPWWGEGDGVSEAVREWVERAADGEYVDFETDLTRPDGERYTLVGVFRPVTDDDGEVVSIVASDRDVSERREYERKLEASNERLEQFAYAASHDLQEPLRMVTSYLQLVDRRYGDRLDDDAQEFIAFAVDGAQRMREMIDGLLQYSRVETRADPFEPVDLERVLEDVREDLQLPIAESDARIEVGPLPRVHGDAGQLRQVFQNLLDNAIEYSGDEPPRIEVSAERDGDEWVVSVRDEGIGIDSPEAGRVFEVFQRLHSHDAHPGTGIGLALSRRIVERHGGEIWVESAPGEGSTFSLTLPAVEDGA